MSLLETIEKDISRIFLNQNHFATRHRLDGKMITCVLDDPSFGTTNKGFEQDLNVGLTYGDYVLRAAKADLQRRYIADQTCNLDGKDMLVIKVSEADGMVYLTLKEHRTW